MNSFDLNPCPFCGQAPNLSMTEHATAGNGQVIIDCCITMVGDFIMDDYVRKGSLDSKMKVLSATVNNWNTRI